MTEQNELNMVDEDLEYEDLEQPEEPVAFVVDNDQKAEWCIHKIVEIDADTERWKRFYTERMKAIEDSNRFRIAHIKQKLIPYLQMVPLKDTKTQRKYSLPSGDLIFKKEHTKVEHDDAVLIEWLRENAPEYIKTKPSVDWRTLKDELREEGGEYFLDIGDTEMLVPGVTDSVVPAEFVVAPKAGKNG